MTKEPSAAADLRAGVRLILKGPCEPLSVRYRTGLRTAETEIEKWRAETGARNPPRKGRNTRNCQPETGAPQPNPRECRRFYPPGKITPRRLDSLADEPVNCEPV